MSGKTTQSQTSQSATQTTAQSGPSAATQTPGQAEQDLYGNAFVAEQMGHGHDHGQEPAPGDGTGAGADLDATRPVGGDVDGDTRSSLIRALRGSAEASSLLDDVEEARGDLSFPLKWSNRGSYHRSGSIFIDRNTDETEWYGTLAHELVHLCTYESGSAADASTMGRDEFVEAKMTDEINAQATAFVALMQVGRFTGEVGLDEFVTWLEEHHPDLMMSMEDPEEDAQNWSDIKGHAATWLEDKYRNEWVTSNTSENYYTYWGNAWDRANPGG